MKVVIYHGGCTDGMACAHLAHEVFGEDAKYVPHYYNSPQTTANKVSAGDSVLALDVSFTRKLGSMLAARNPKEVTWLDHHESSFEVFGIDSNQKPVVTVEEFDPRFLVSLDINKCGALMTYAYLFPLAEVPEYLLDIDDQDRFVNVRPSARAFKFGINALQPWTFKTWSNVESRYKIIVESGRPPMEVHDRMVQSILRSKTLPISLKDELGNVVRGLSANCDNVFFTDVGHALATESGTYGLIWNIARDGLVTVNLRGVNNPEVSCARIATAYGGGGHYNASGFSMKVSDFFSHFGITE